VFGRYMFGVWWERGFALCSRFGGMVEKEEKKEKKEGNSIIIIIIIINLTIIYYLFMIYDLFYK